MQVSLFMLDDELQDLCFLSSGCDGKFTLVNVQQSGLCVMDWPGFQLSPVSAGGSRAGVPVKNLFPSSLPQHSGPHPPLCHNRRTACMQANTSYLNMYTQYTKHELKQYQLFLQMVVSPIFTVHKVFNSFCAFYFFKFILLLLQ